MSEFYDHINGSQIFTMIDLKKTNHLIRINEDHEWTIPFRSGYGLYEFLVILFGLPKVSVTIQDIITHIFRYLLDNQYLAFIDYVYIYAKMRMNMID
jgi:hypothetical protein